MSSKNLTFKNLRLNRSRAMGNESGMTLLEIMIVLAILGGLIAVLATQVTGRLKKARVENAKIQMAEMQKALDMFYTDCGFYPTTAEGLEALVQAPTSCPNWGPDSYIKKIAKDPWGSDFIYEATGGDFILISLGADRTEGGEGENADITSDEI